MDMTTVDESVTGADSTDMVRLQEMHAVARRIMVNSGLDPERWRCEVNWNRRLEVGVQKQFSNMLDWSIMVERPSDDRMGHNPATMRLGGAALITPLCKQMIDALSALMWSDRET